MSAHVSDPDLVVLHTLRCSGAGSAERLAALVAPLIPDDAESLLLHLAAHGLAAYSGGPFGGWSLTEAGRDADAQRIARELDHAGARDDVQAAYDDFVGLNTRTLDICGDWQIRSSGPPMVLNDHTDRVHDGRVLARLAAVDAEVQPLCAALAARLHRFSHYGPGLRSALDRARQGELDMVTDTLDSYHGLWFRLHEDLLTTLGISREA